MITFFYELIGFLIMPFLILGMIFAAGTILIYLPIVLISSLFGATVSLSMIPEVYLNAFSLIYVVGGFCFIQVKFIRDGGFKFLWLEVFESTDIQYKKLMRQAPFYKDENAEASEQEIAQGSKNENGALGLLTGAIFFLIFWDFNTFASETLGLNMRNIFIAAIAGVMVPLGIARVIAAATHKLLKRIKPSFYFGKTILFSSYSQENQLAERLYRYALWSLIIFDIVYFIRIMQSV